ncbi:hypothetical protein, partial [Roseomonas rosulenta]|uniref:hypothetical protein n=1 Tax=Roseomonas rosulenta TaxID=2748667 RepID=UPI0018DFDBA5
PPLAAATPAGRPEALPVTQGRVLASIVAVPPGVPGVSMRVFLGLASASADTPVTDPHYVGIFTFFDDPAAHAGHGAGGEATRSFVVDVTRTVQRLVRAGQPVEAETQLVLVPVLPGGSPPSVTIREVSLAVS